MTVITEEIFDAQLIGTEAGLEHVADNTNLFERIGQFCLADIKPERCFEDTSSIGMGGNSEVREVDGMAVKLSTKTTGRIAWEQGPTAPENLLHQCRFMDRLAAYFQDNEEIIVPKQYAALRSRQGAYLSVQQYMKEWKSVHSWLRDNEIGNDNQVGPLLDTVRARIQSAVDSRLIRLGLEDLGLRSRRTLHTENILVPADSKQLDDARLCIIDQPSRGLHGRIAVAGIWTAAQKRMHAFPARSLR